MAQKSNRLPSIESRMSAVSIDDSTDAAPTSDQNTKKGTSTKLPTKVSSSFYLPSSQSLAHYFTPVLSSKTQKSPIMPTPARLITSTPNSLAAPCSSWPCPTPLFHPHPLFSEFLHPLSLKRSFHPPNLLLASLARTSSSCALRRKRVRMPTLPSRGLGLRQRKSSPYPSRHSMARSSNSSGLVLPSRLPGRNRAARPCQLSPPSPRLKSPPPQSPRPQSRCHN